MEAIEGDSEEACIPHGILSRKEGGHLMQRVGLTTTSALTPNDIGKLPYHFITRVVLKQEGSNIQQTAYI